jgi:hypothetical protein
MLAFANGADDKLKFRFKVGGTTKEAVSTDALVNGNSYTLHFIKDGGSLKIYINGSEVSYDKQDTYDLGNKTFTDQLQVGWTSITVKGKVYWAATYEVALSGARISTNHGLGNSMGLYGYNVGDVMTLQAQPNIIPLLLRTVCARSPIITNSASTENKKKVTITSRQYGSTIYYTLDGTNPTSRDRAYSNPFWIEETTTVAAIEKKCGCLDSIPTRRTFTITSDITAPTGGRSVNTLLDAPSNILVTEA